MRLYRGTTSRDPQLRPLRSGRVPKYTWFTDIPEEAEKYAQVKAKSGSQYGGTRFKGGKPVVVEADIPDDSVWQLGGGTEGRSRYFKTYKVVHTEVREI